MRIVLKPGGIALLVVAFLCVIGFIYANQQRQSQVVVAPSPQGTPAPPAPGAPTASGTPSADVRGQVVPVCRLYRTSRGDTAETISGTLMNGAKQKAGKTGIFLTFNGGAQQWVDIDHSLVDTTHSFSVSAWVKLDDASGFQTFVSQEGNAISGFYFQKRRDTGEFSMTLNREDSISTANEPQTGHVGFRAQSGFQAVSGTWYHLVGICDATKRQEMLYVNGELRETTTLPAGVNLWRATGHTVLGTGMWDHGRTDFVSGTVGDIRIYDHALSGREVSALYDQKSSAGV